MFPPRNNDHEEHGLPPQPPSYLDPDQDHDLMTIWNAAPDVTPDGYNYCYYPQPEQDAQFIHHELGQQALLHSTPTIPAGQQYGGEQDDNTKKANRKEIERQRRKQMSSLHSSLISLLPHHSLKGKRSMSDHMGEAVNYIKHLETNIGELSGKRDKLKGSVLEVEQQLTNAQDSASSGVTVLPHAAGHVEVLISSGEGGGEKGFELSRVVEAVIEEGFDVTSCISTQRNGRLYNTMQCQAGEGAGYIDLRGLQRKLNRVLSYK